MKEQKQETLSIAIVDSGLGGLAICADIANGFVERRSHSQVDLTYFNAWPEQSRGYNRLPDHGDQIRVFDSVLTRMEKTDPDLILIACNTLSILYPETPFARSTKIPVVGIIDFGVKMVYDRMRESPESQAIILGTLTTITSETHKKRLVDLGISPTRIIGQPCDQLATQIEGGPDTESVSMMIDGFLKQVSSHIDRNGAPVFAVFCCTHFDYARKLFEVWLEHHIKDPVTILNPNKAMSDYVMRQYKADRVEKTRVTVEVLSRIIWHEDQVKAITETLSLISPLTADALRNYRQDENLFKVTC